MMSSDPNDQAADLRRLVLQATRQQAATAAPAPQLIVTAAAHAGAGATTIALNLAVALAQQGRRVVLVDADRRAPRVAIRCRLAPRGTLHNVLSQRLEVHEVLEPGPCGIQVAPGAVAIDDSPALAAAHDRLIEQLRKLGRHAEAVVVDVGAAVDDIARRYWWAADEVLLAAACEPQAIMEAYAAIKLLAAPAPGGRLRVALNAVDDEATACAALDRLAQCADRFLDFHLAPGLVLPFDAAIAAAEQQGRPLALVRPRNRSVAPLERLAASLAIDHGSPVARAA